jgi:hypothetical protein
MVYYNNNCHDVEIICKRRQCNICEEGKRHSVTLELPYLDTPNNEDYDELYLYNKQTLRTLISSFV